MPIHYLDQRATPEQFAEMLGELETLIKFAVDICRGVVAGGGEFHADCEGVLLQQGSSQQDIWGADYLPDSDAVRCEAMINLMPSRANPSLKIIDPEIRRRTEAVLRALLPERAI
jgi:hypothetical protein